MPESARSRPDHQCSVDAKVSSSASARRAVATNRASWVALLEDDEDQGELLCHWIRPLLAGRELHWFRRVAEFFDHLAAAQRGAPCLLLCDYELGDGDALTVMERIAAACRASTERPCEGADEVAGDAGTISVVVVSAHTDPARREAVLGAGAAGWLTKPVSRGDVQRTVTEFVDAPRGEQEAASSRS